MEEDYYLVDNMDIEAGDEDLLTPFKEDQLTPRSLTPEPVVLVAPRVLQKRKRPQHIFQMKGKDLFNRKRYRVDHKKEIKIDHCENICFYISLFLLCLIIALTVYIDYHDVKENINIDHHSYVFNNISYEPLKDNFPPLLKNNIEDKVYKVLKRKR